MRDFAAARAAATTPEGIRIVFVYQGDADDGESWFGPLDRGAVAVADPDRSLSAVFGLERGGLWEMFGPRAVACGLRAAAKGNLIGLKQGDPWTLPLVVAVRDAAVVWERRGRHAGDDPRPDELLRALRVDGILR